MFEAYLLARLRPRDCGSRAFQHCHQCLSGKAYLRMRIAVQKKTSIPFKLRFGFYTELKRPQSSPGCVGFRLDEGCQAVDLQGCRAVYLENAWKMVSVDVTHDLWEDCSDWLQDGSQWEEALHLLALMPKRPMKPQAWATAGSQFASLLVLVELRIAKHLRQVVVWLWNHIPILVSAQNQWSLILKGI